MNEYIDVRGSHPIYFCGSLFYRLPANARGWSLQQVRHYILSTNIDIITKRLLN